MRKFIALILSFGLYSCGYDESQLHGNMFDAKNSWLIHPSNQEIEESLAVEGSYIVGFKSPETRLQAYSYSNSGCLGVMR